jgi:hypothetical protein
MQKKKSMNKLNYKKLVDEILKSLREKYEVEVIETDAKNREEIFRAIELSEYESKYKN